MELSEFLNLCLGSAKVFSESGYGFLSEILLKAFGPIKKAFQGKGIPPPPFNQESYFDWFPFSMDDKGCAIPYFLTVYI